MQQSLRFAIGGHLPEHAMSRHQQVRACACQKQGIVTSCAAVRLTAEAHRAIVTLRGRVQMIGQSWMAAGSTASMLLP